MDLCSCLAFAGPAAHTAAGAHGHGHHAAGQSSTCSRIIGLLPLHTQQLTSSLLRRCRRLASQTPNTQSSGCSPPSLYCTFTSGLLPASCAATPPCMQQRASSGCPRVMVADAVDQVHRHLACWSRSMIASEGARQPPLRCLGGLPRLHSQLLRWRDACDDLLTAPAVPPQGRPEDARCMLHFTSALSAFHPTAIALSDPCTRAPR